MPATTLARNSNEEQCEPINLEKKTQKISKYCSATLCGLSPPLSSTDIFPTWASGGLHTPEYTEDSDINAVNSIQTDHTKCAERNLVRICGRSRGRKTLGTCTVTVNTRNKTKCGTQMALYSKRYLADAIGHRYGNSGRGKGNSCKFCRSNITHPSVAKQSEDTKRKHTKLTVIRNNQKNDGRIKKTCPRRTKGQGLSNNNKSLSTLGSLDTDQLRFQEYLFTGNAEQISHHIMKKRFINRFLITSNQELVRKRGMQTSTLKERIETVTSASPCVPETNNIQRNYELINNGQQQWPSGRKSSLITIDCSSPDTTSTENKNSTAVATSSFQNNKQQMKRLSEYSAPLATEYQQNFIPVSDNIHNICTPYYPQEASGIPYNDNYFPSHQNNEGEQCTDKYENTSMWGEIIKFNRGQEFPLDEVRRHADQQNEYHEENTIQNGYQNLANEIEANHYAYQLQCKTSKLNNEDLQQVETYHHTDTFRCTYDCCRSNQPMSTQNSAICQQSSEILKLDEIQNYELPSPQINSFAGVRQSTVAINENIHNQQIINNLECANVLPDTEIFQGVHWQKLDSCSGHKTAAMQGKHVNNEESIAHNWERHRTSSYSGLPYDYRIHLPTDSNSLSKPEGKFPQPSSQSIENFRLKEVVHLSDDRKVMQKGSKKKCAKNQRRRREPKGKSKPDKSYVCLTCGKREQYNVLLKRHMELHHGNSSIQK
ncbi:hypothetical protein B7P43_G13148 [Cryptotermes secundus]|uniref:C2H2-type domain-containing protein n=1 Tax=Cryptotermes secundus TaxID=105785 RepID=A0A2J7PBQ4_9NEOP|nr:hypothetical protein B7P43_G13148 [Cryptotermes secundus]